VANFWDEYNQRALEAAQGGSNQTWADFERQQQLKQALLARQKPQSQPQPAAPTKKGSLLTSLMPTAGGTAGALGGAAAGAAIGSVIPIAGTAVGGLIGAILGGAGGSALGKVGENAVEGEKDLSSGVAGEALMGGLTSTPLTAGFKLAGAGVKAATGVGGKAAGQLVREAGAASIPRMAGGLQAKAANEVAGTAAGAASRFGTTGKLKNMGDQALLSQYGTISKPIARQTNPTETISTLADAGLIKPADVEHVSSSITGSGGLVNQAVAKAVGGAGDVDTSTLRRVFQDALDNHGVVEKDRKSLTTLFDAQMNRLSGGAQGSLNPKVNPTEALATMRAFEDRIANLTGKGGNYSLPTPERVDQAHVLKLVRDELQDQLYNGAGANANIQSVLTPKLREDLVNLMPKNAKWQQYVDKNVMSAQDVGSLRSAQAPFVRAGKIMDEGDINAMTFGGRAGNAFATGGLKDMVGTAATNLVKDPLARASGQALRTLGGASAGRTGARAGQSLLGAAAREGGGRLLTSQPQPTDPSLQNALPPELAGLDPSQLDPSLDPTGQLNSSAAPEAPTNPFGVSREEVAQGLVKAMQANDKVAVSQLQDLYSLVSDYEDSQAKSVNMNATTQKALAQSANADSTLTQLEQMLNQAGGASGPVGGNISSFMGGLGLNNNAKTYNDLAAGSVTQIAKALGETGAMSDSDRIAYQSLLPRITDTPEVAANKFAALRARMAAAHQNTLHYGGGGGSSLEDALMASGY
jgi:hypothetical protein